MDAETMAICYVGLVIMLIAVGMSIIMAVNDASKAISADIAAQGVTQQHRHEAVTRMLDQLQDTLNAMQVDKLKVYVNERNDKLKLAPQAMDFEASQKAVLEEFKEN